MDKLYYINSLEDNQLEEQLKWTKNELIETEKSTIYFASSKGDVYECYKNANKKYLIIALNKTEPEESKFLACPIYPYNDLHNKPVGIDLGVIPEISLRYSFVAAIHEIRFINKTSVVLCKESDLPLYICEIANYLLSNILINYKKLLEFALKDKKTLKFIHDC